MGDRGHAGGDGERHFKGKDVVAALPANEVFIDHLKWPKKFDGKIEDALFAKVKQKLPFEPIEKNTMIKYIPAEQDNLIVLATERTVIDHHLAIYERAGLAIHSIGVWPVALAAVLCPVLRPPQDGPRCGRVCCSTSSRTARTW